MSTDATTLARRLVATPSHDDPDEVGSLLESWLREHTDATVERDEVGNVFARRGGGDCSLALVGHHDVVPPDPGQQDESGYVVEERDGRLFGRGSADMKGSLAAMACAFRDSDPAGELVFASFVGEEQGGTGCRAAIRDGFAPEYAVVGEGSTGYSAPGVTDVAVAHKGRRASTITARGTAAHASEPGAGTNAIYRATDAVDVIRGLSTPETTVRGKRVQGSLEVTEIHGGDAWNMIPDRCTVTVDERTVPGERAGLETVELIEGVTWSVEQDLPPMACRDERFAAVALAVAQAIQDGDPEHVVKPHATDAGWLAAEADTQTLVIGAAEPGQAHTADESVSTAALERCQRLYRTLAERFP
ncbi:M20 family metallopeptidase [Halapricum hydrolyticum]|uniref:M20/M25/M40 family metallo-hydrolase n=1 Tax=Halapricum hydrolyticum TaxID=2979991 RepID=A0AAE3IF21_9EURY|nr:M20/M25/M40 family metallo-hydrolase [Halapricum hydrolyticum]MCU4717995.1 M20/M25/M40 family metallo-hydrolase [Halapricum hydrolyticum]MCU4727160.1 M20/M25/M40 family metallo-hydrolase [Halapricum hydrolyticum]